MPANGNVCLRDAVHQSRHRLCCCCKLPEGAPSMSKPWRAGELDVRQARCVMDLIAFVPTPWPQFALTPEQLDMRERNESATLGFLSDDEEAEDARSPPKTGVSPANAALNLLVRLGSRKNTV